MASAKRLLSTKRAIVGMLAAAAFGLTASPALAATTVDTNWCTNPLLTQPFLAWGDSNYYTLMPGESVDNFAGTGWTLSGGAKVVTTTLADGKTAKVLDLPSGSKAVSPAICVQQNYPTARTMVRNVVGSEGVFFYVSYQGTSTWNTPQNTGQVHGTDTSWTLSDPVNLQPYNYVGWQVVKLTFVPGGTGSLFQLYNVYVDPYAKR